MCRSICIVKFQVKINIFFFCVLQVYMLRTFFLLVLISKKKISATKVVEKEIKEEKCPIFLWNVYYIKKNHLDHSFLFPYILSEYTSFIMKQPFNLFFNYLPEPTIEFLLFFFCSYILQIVNLNKIYTKQANFVFSFSQIHTISSPIQTLVHNIFTC